MASAAACTSGTATACPIRHVVMPDRYGHPSDDFLWSDILLGSRVLQGLPFRHWPGVWDIPGNFCSLLMHPSARPQGLFNASECLQTGAIRHVLNKITPCDSGLMSSTIGSGRLSIRWHAERIRAFIDSVRISTFSGSVIYQGCAQATQEEGWWYVDGQIGLLHLARAGLSPQRHCVPQRGIGCACIVGEPCRSADRTQHDAQTALLHAMTTSRTAGRRARGRSVRLRQGEQAIGRGSFSQPLSGSVL